jgi:hypothetical protein
MIEVHREDRDYLRFLWWEDPSQMKVKELRHTRVVFGVNCSPFLLAAVIEKHLSMVEGPEKPVADKLLGSLYVDNSVTSVDSLEEYEEFRMVCTKIMAEAKMELRQWERTIGEGTGVGPTMDPGCGLVSGSGPIPLAVTSVLGMKWNKCTDQIFCVVPKHECLEKITKRVILSLVQKIFDPMGFLSPALLPPKLMIQRAWAKEVGWDQVLDEEAHRDFQQWGKEVEILEQIRLPRKVTGNHKLNEVQLHTFTDGSQSAFAAAVFLRIQDEDGVSVQLLQAKTRVAPLKKMTIPRFELLSCTIGARLATAVVKAIEIEDVQKFFWSDSTTALQWIKRNDDWGTFVGNRVR